MSESTNNTKNKLQEKESEILNILNDNPTEVTKKQLGRMSFEFSIKGNTVFNYEVEQVFPAKVKYHYIINDDNINILIEFLKSKEFNF